MPGIFSLLLTAIIVLPVMITFSVAMGMASIKLSIRNKLIPWDLNKVEKLDTDFFESISQKLISAGFEYENDYKIDECLGAGKAGSNTKEMYMRRFVHKHLATSAQIYHTIVRTSVKSAGETLTNTSYKKSLGLDTFFQNGLSICSTTQVEPRIFEEANSIYLAYTNFSDLDKLIDEHMDRVKHTELKHNLSHEMVNLSSEVFTNRMLKNTYMRQVDRKVLRHDAEHGWFKFTFRGAIGALVKTLKFDMLEKKKLQKQANAFVTYSYITKTKPTLPSILYHINFTVSIWFGVTHIFLLYNRIESFLQLIFLLMSQAAVLFCIIITLLYKIIKNKQGDNLTL